MYVPYPIPGLCALSEKLGEHVLESIIWLLLYHGFHVRDCNMIFLSGEPVYNHGFELEDPLTFKNFTGKTVAPKCLKLV